MPITLLNPLPKTPTRFFSRKTQLSPRIHLNNLSFPPNSPLLTKKANVYGSSPFKNNFYKFPLIYSHKNRGFITKAQNESASTSNNENQAENEEIEALGQSSMPERFRYMTKEAQEKPVRWPWLIVLAFMLYTWRTVLWELSNWKRTTGTIFQFLKYISKLLVALLFHFIGDLITASIQGVETTFYTIRAYYSSIIAYAPIRELITVIMLTSAVLAIAETAVPDSVNRQPYLLTLAGLIGFAAVRNYITELFFWTLLLGLFGFAKIIKKRDYVSSALPVAAVLAAVGEPWIRVITIGSYLALAIFYHSKNTLGVQEGEDVNAVLPVPLLCAAMAIGLRVAAKWAGYRHLTWMIV